MRQGGCLATAELFRRESFRRRSPPASQSSLSARGSEGRDAPGPKALRSRPGPQPAQPRGEADRTRRPKPWTKPNPNRLKKKKERKETKAVFLQARQRGFATVSSLPAWSGKENPFSSAVGKQGASTPPASGLNSNHQQQGLYTECEARATPSQPLGVSLQMRKLRLGEAKRKQVSLTSPGTGRGARGAALELVFPPLTTACLEAQNARCFANHRNHWRWVPLLHQSLELQAPKTHTGLQPGLPRPGL